MEDAKHEMARRFYGYGRWDAPYWFIGPEPGKGRNQPADNTPRVKAWRRRGGTELLDCHDFHRRIGEKNWHKDVPLLQPTWRPLMLLLMTFLEKPGDDKSLRTYQRDRWGRVSGGETCVIELSGLAAKSLKVPMDRGSFRQERIEIIHQRMHTYKPQLVVMYGGGQKGRKHWEEIAGSVFPADGILKLGYTTIALAPHPVVYGSKDQDWVKLGQRLRGL